MHQLETQIGWLHHPDKPTGQHAEALTLLDMAAAAGRLGLEAGIANLAGRPVNTSAPGLYDHLFAQPVGGEWRLLWTRPAPRGLKQIIITDDMREALKDAHAKQTEELLPLAAKLGVPEDEARTRLDTVHIVPLGTREPSSKHGLWVPGEFSAANPGQSGRQNWVPNGFLAANPGVTPRKTGMGPTAAI